MNIKWEDIDRKNLFTNRNAEMINLETGKKVQYYSANTKIVVVQKAQVGEKTYYRTSSARDSGLNLALEASAFGLPNDIAPSAHPRKIDCKGINPSTPEISNVKKQTVSQKPESSNDGEKTRIKKFINKIFRRKK